MTIANDHNPEAVQVTFKLSDAEARALDARAAVDKVSRHKHARRIVRDALNRDELPTERLGLIVDELGAINSAMQQVREELQARHNGTQVGPDSLDRLTNAVLSIAELIDSGVLQTAQIRQDIATLACGLLVNLAGVSIDDARAWLAANTQR